MEIKESIKKVLKNYAENDELLKDKEQLKNDFKKAKKWVEKLMLFEVINFQKNFMKKYFYFLIF